MLLCGSDSWVVTGAMLKVLEGFHHRAAWNTTVLMDWRTEDGEWIYPPVDDAMESVGLWPIKEYTGDVRTPYQRKYPTGQSTSSELGRNGCRYLVR